MFKIYGHIIFVLRLDIQNVWFVRSTTMMWYVDMLIHALMDMEFIKFLLNEPIIMVAN